MHLRILRVMQDIYALSIKAKTDLLYLLFGINQQGIKFML